VSLVIKSRRIVRSACGFPNGLRVMSNVSLTLLERIARGDADAVPECLALYGGLVWSLARKYSAEPSDAEDAAQEVFIDLWRNAVRFDPTVASEATFVAMIARRRLVDRSRKRGRTVSTTSLPEGDGPISPPTVDRAAIDDEAARVRECLAEIRPEQRVVLEMAIDRGMSHADISAALGTPLGTVKAHARRGLLRLRELVGGPNRSPLSKGDAR